MSQLKNTFILLALCLSLSVHLEGKSKQPNILFAISDDQSFAHTGFAGCKFVNTPAFDRVASEGIYFSNCYAGSPGCAPSRSTLVTGRYHWQNEQSGQHASSWLKKYVPFIDLLEANGYYTGRTGKGVRPFQYAVDANDTIRRKTDAAGIEHSTIRYKNGKKDERTATGIATTNYTANFKYFIKNRKDNQPFFFWYGATEPHRKYEKGSWKRNGKHLKDVVVPGFYPDNEEIRGDILDYAVEIDWFDRHLSQMIAYLEEIGELENTIIIVTSDNGMPFPRAKANTYEYGVHVPFAVRFPKQFPGGRVVDDPISFVDIAPTILSLTNTLQDGMQPISGRDISNLLNSKKQGIINPAEHFVFTGRERHSASRYLNWGYPQRAIHSKDYLYIWNIKPERYPAGAPQRFKSEKKEQLLPMFGLGKKGKYIKDAAYSDVDDSPSKAFLIEHHNDENIKPYFDLAYAKRPEVELFDLGKDPFCITNVAGKREYADIKKEMKKALMKELIESKDPRVVGPDTEIFDSYKRYSKMRYFPESK